VLRTAPRKAQAHFWGSTALKRKMSKGTVHRIKPRKVKA
jgi:hypothetical protein